MDALNAYTQARRVMLQLLIILFGCSKLFLVGLCIMLLKKDFSELEATYPEIAITYMDDSDTYFRDLKLVMV